MLTDFSKENILKHAETEYPKECCGLLINVRGRERYIPCRNISWENNQFTIHPEDYVLAEEQGDILAVVHSHCNYPATASTADISGCENGVIPWVIVSWPSKQFNIIKPEGIVIPLLGREFIHGSIDCYGLIRDYYKQILNISLPDFPRTYDWWLRGENLYLKGFEKAGFTIVQDLKIHDVIFIQVGSPSPNHAGVYVGDSIVMHHALGKLSCRENYSGFWRKNTYCVVRHKDLL